MSDHHKLSKKDLNSANISRVYRQKSDLADDRVKCVRCGAKKNRNRIRDRGLRL